MLVACSGTHSWHVVRKAQCEASSTEQCLPAALAQTKRPMPQTLLAEAMLDRLLQRSGVSVQAEPDAHRMASMSWLGASAIFIPLPPPPLTALTSNGKPTRSASATSLGVGQQMGTHVVAGLLPAPVHRDVHVPAVRSWP